LDARVVPAVFNVNTTADVLGGARLSLRQAILNANHTPGPNVINLTVPGTYRLTRFGNAHDGTFTSASSVVVSSDRYAAGMFRRATSGWRRTAPASPVRASHRRTVPSQLPEAIH
jgi:hypothetical protein